MEVRGSFLIHRGRAADLKNGGLRYLAYPEQNATNRENRERKDRHPPSEPALPEGCSHAPGFLQIRHPDRNIDGDSDKSLDRAH